MKIGRAFKSKIIIILFCIILIVGFLTLDYLKIHPQPQSQANSSPSPSPNAVVFQPEAAMLTQAEQPGNQVDGTSTSFSPSGLATSTTAAGYIYDPTVCSNVTSTAYFCFSAFYKQLTLKYGVDTAFVDIKTRYTQNSEILSDCHPLMHIIGQAAAIIYPDISEAYEHGDSFCWSGYYHGILEGVALKIGPKNLPSQMNSICANIPGKSTYDFEYYNCLHGLGHGVMELNDDDVPTSLHVCDNLTGIWEEESCYSGVFMENVIHDSVDHDSKWLKPTDLLYPCDAVDTKYQGECYLGQTSYALQHNNYNFVNVYALCATVAEPFRDVCDQSLGRDAANQANHTAAATAKTCNLSSNPSDVTNCVIGAAKEIVSYYHSDVQAKAFCNVLDTANQNVCMSTTADYYKNF
jgi:hypothetical protein